MANFNWESGVNGDWGTAADWGGAVPNSATANATISAAGAYEVTIDSGESFVVNSVTLNNATATLDVLGTLNLGASSGGTVDQLVVDAGVLIVSGEIADGTIVAGAGNVILSDGATLDDITYKGSLALATGTYIDVEGGLKVETPSGSSPGTIDLTAEGQGIYVEDSENLNNVVINLGSNASGDYYDFLYANDSTGALTFGSAATIVSNNTAGYNYLTGYTILNDGQISVASGELYLESNTFSNAGTINIATGGELILYTTGFTNSGVIDVNGGTLDVDAALSLSALGDVSISPAGVLDVSSTLYLGGGTLAVHGSQNFEISGTVEDGIIVPGAGTVSLSDGAVLDDITYKGSLALATGTYIYIEGGLKVETPSGSSPGTIDLTAEGQSIGVLDNEDLNNVVIYLGANATGDYYDDFNAEESSGALTFGSAATIVSNNTAAYNYLTGYTIINDGHISVASGELYLESTKFTNAGTINIATGGELILYTTGFTNSGVIDVSGGTLDVDAALSLSALGDVSISPAGVLDVSSTLFLGGGTLAVHGSQNFEISGTVEDGTIVPGAGSVSLSDGAVLDDITYKGSLALATNTYIYIEGGLKVETPSGASPGTIDLTAEGQTIYIEDNEDLNHVVINLGSTASGDYYDDLDAQDSSGALTLGSAATIISNNTAGYNYLTGDTILNDGQISIATGEFYIDPTLFTNAGTINVQAGALLFLTGTTLVNKGIFEGSGAGTASIDLAPTTFSSYVAGTLISGGFEANAGDTLALDIENTGSIVLDDGVLILNGAGSEIETYNNTTATYTLIETSLQTIGSTGTFEVIGGRNETIGHTLDVAGGELVLGGGNFTATKLTLAGASARLFGFGTVQDSIANAGTITANGGLLDITGAITGAGKLVIDAAATLELGGTSAEAVDFAGAGALTILKLETPTSYTGTLSVPTGGAVIDIADTTVNSATLSGTNLLVTLAGGTVLDYHLAATLAGGVITVTPDGGTGSDITFYQQAAASAASPNPVNFGEAHVGTALSQFLTIANTRAAGGYSEGLDVSFSGTSSDITDSGAISLLAGGATNSSSLKVTLASGASGSFGGDAVITLSSDGTGTDGYGKTSLGSQTIAVEGKLFNLASPTLASDAFNFGVVHVGQAVAEFLTLSNGTTLAAYTETLDGSLGGASSGVEASGSIAVAAGASNNSGLSVGLNTGASGSISGTATLTLVSNGSGIDTLGTTALGSAVIDVTGTVDNYATLAIEKTAGTGTLTTVSATHYTLNLGSVTEGATAPTVGIGALNAATGTADLLNGSFSLSGTTDFTNTGFGAYSGEAAGHADTSPTISLGTGALGTYTETIVVYGTGSNASGYSGALAPETLTVTGTVVAAAARPTPDIASVGSVNPDFSAMNFVSPAGQANAARSAPVTPAGDGFESGLTGWGGASIAFQRSGAGTFEGTPSLAGGLEVPRFQLDHPGVLGAIPTGWPGALAPPLF
jgi:hypothetical protein